MSKTLSLLVALSIHGHTSGYPNVATHSLYDSSSCSPPDNTCPFTNITDQNLNTYALATYRSIEPYFCPPGNFGYIPNISGYCYHNDANGVVISGWALVHWPSIVSDYQGFAYKVCNQQDGCSGSYCTSSTETRFFASPNYNHTTPTSTDWAYVGTIYTPVGTCSEGQFPTPWPATGVLVARGAHGNARPDPRIYEIRPGAVGG
jgi:hypothetical protein